MDQSVLDQKLRFTVRKFPLSLAVRLYENRQNYFIDANIRERDYWKEISSQLFEFKPTCPGSNDSPSRCYSEHVTVITLYTGTFQIFPYCATCLIYFHATG